jgi:hypothetical protein
MSWTVGEYTLPLIREVDFNVEKFEIDCPVRMDCLAPCRRFNSYYEKTNEGYPCQGSREGIGGPRKELSIRIR